MTGLGHVALYVRALEPALAFYRDIVGLRSSAASSPATRRC